MDIRPLFDLVKEPFTILKIAESLWCQIPNLTIIIVTIVLWYQDIVAKIFAWFARDCSSIKIPEFAVAGPPPPFPLAHRQTSSVTGLIFYQNFRMPLKLNEEKLVRRCGGGGRGRASMILKRPDTVESNQKSRSFNIDYMPFFSARTVERSDKTIWQIRKRSQSAPECWTGTFLMAVAKWNDQWQRQFY